MFSGQTRYRIEIENFITLSLGVNFFRGAGISATTSFFSSTSASLTWIMFIHCEATGRRSKVSGIWAKGCLVTGILYQNQKLRKVKTSDILISTSAWGKFSL